jgi:hypothetical protein
MPTPAYIWSKYICALTTAARIMSSAAAVSRWARSLSRSLVLSSLAAFSQASQLRTLRTTRLIACSVLS